MSLGKYLFNFSRQHGSARTCEFFSRGRKEKKIADDQISLRDLAESFGGPDWAQTLHPGRRVRESGGAHASAIDPSAFADVGGQLLIDEVFAGYNAAPLTLRSLIGERAITNGNLGEAKVPYAAGVENDPDEIQPGMPYPHTRFRPQWITLQPPKKWGLKCLVTMEAIFANETIDVMKGARSVGNRVQVWEEQQTANVVMGLTNPYKRNDTAYNTYLTSGAWVNKKSGIQIQDWNQLNDAENLFGEMVDPVTGLPLDINPTTLLVMPYRLRSAEIAVSASTIYSGTYPASGVPSSLLTADNPVRNAFQVATSRYAYRALINSGVSAANAREYAVLADFKRAFVWRYAEKFRTFELPPNSMLEWNQDIVFGVKARTWGSANVYDPLAAVMLYNS